MLSGDFNFTHAVLSNLIAKHGGAVIKTVKSANYLVTSHKNYEANSTHVVSAKTAGVFIVSEMFIYQSILKSKKMKAAKFGFEKTKEQPEKKQNQTDDAEIKPLPLEDGPSNTADDDDDEDEVPPLPMCKYGADCYRKNAEHFKEFAHPWLIQ